MNLREIPRLQHITYAEDVINELKLLVVSLGRGKANLKTSTSEKYVLKWVSMYEDTMVRCIWLGKGPFNGLLPKTN